MDKTQKQGAGILAILKGMLISWLVTGILLLLLSGLLTLTGLSANTAGGIMLAIYILSPLAGGFYLGKRAEEKKYLWGMLFGILYFILFALISILVNPPGIFSFPLIIKLFLLQSLGGMAGGMIS